MADTFVSEFDRNADVPKAPPFGVIVTKGENSAEIIAEALSELIRILFDKE